MAQGRGPAHARGLAQHRPPVTPCKPVRLRNPTRRRRPVTPRTLAESRGPTRGPSPPMPGKLTQLWERTMRSPASLCGLVHPRGLAPALRR